MMNAMTRISSKVWSEPAAELSRFETSGFASPPRGEFALIDYWVRDIGRNPPSLMPLDDCTRAKKNGDLGY
jgi:hypothetical protein